MDKDFVIIIPARYSSSRFPGKPLADIKGKTMINRVWEKCITAAAQDKVYIATDDHRIQNHCLEKGMNVVMTPKECLTGTDRIAEVSSQIEATFYINVQGDEPLIDPSDISKVINSYYSDPDKTHCAMTIIRSDDEFRSTNIPKVVTDFNNNLLYISRSAIPSNKEDSFITSMKQVCIYAFPKKYLKIFYNQKKKTPIEAIEDIEYLRFLELGYRIKTLKMSSKSIAVDTKKDLKKVKKIISLKK